MTYKLITNDIAQVPQDCALAYRYRIGSDGCVERQSDRTGRWVALRGTTHSYGRTVYLTTIGSTRGVHRLVDDLIANAFGAQPTPEPEPTPDGWVLITEDMVDLVDGRTLAMQYRIDQDGRVESRRLDGSGQWSVIRNSVGPAKPISLTIRHPDGRRGQVVRSRDDLVTAAYGTPVETNQETPDDHDSDLDRMISTIRRHSDRRLRMTVTRYAIEEV